MKKILVILLTGSLLFANSAFAGRFGGGRSSGMQRSASPSYSSSNYGRSSQQAATPPTGSGQQQRSGMGAGSAAMLGAAAGAAGGYMLGKSNSNNGNVPNASGGVAAKASEEAKSSIPWGTIAILVAILALGLMFFRKKINPGLSSGNPMNNNFNSNSSSNFNVPNIDRTPNGQANKPTSKPILRFGSSAPAAPEQIDKMPDGIETIYFLRQAKGMFLHIQSMNSTDNVSEIQKYMTAQLFAETKDDILKNQTLADFTNLDCQLLQCEAVEASQTEDGQAVEAHLVASVKFFGNVSENPEQPPVPFSEIWNFVKSESTNNKWIVAGIQQETVKS